MKSIMKLFSRTNMSVSLRARLLGGFTVFALVAIVLVAAMGNMFSRYQAIDLDRRETAEAARAAERLRAAVVLSMFETADYSTGGSGERWRDVANRVNEFESGAATALKSATVGTQGRFSLVQQSLNNLRSQQALVLVASGPAESPKAAREAEAAARSTVSSLDKLVSGLDSELDDLGRSAARQDNIRTSFTWAAAVILGFLAIIFGFLSYFTLISRLRKIQDGVRRVAAGSVSARLDEGGRDELAALYRSLAAPGLPLLLTKKLSFRGLNRRLCNGFGGPRD